MRFFFQDRPKSENGKDIVKRWKGGNHNFWWSDNNGKKAVAATRVGSTNEWKTPQLSFTLFNAADGRANAGDTGRFKLEVKLAGKDAWELQKSDGTCTNEHGDFYIEPTGKVATQPDGVTKADDCVRTCPAGAWALLF